MNFLGTGNLGGDGISTKHAKSILSNIVSISEMSVEAVPRTRKLGDLGREEDYSGAHLQSDIQCRSIEGHHYSTSTTALHESHLAMCGFKIAKKLEQANRRKL
jgi:hypothetical protein